MSSDVRAKSARKISVLKQYAVECEGGDFQHRDTAGTAQEHSFKPLSCVFVSAVSLCLIPLHVYSSEIRFNYRGAVMV